MDPITLIFAGLAVFVIFKLISVLGMRTGHEQRRDIEGLQRATRSEEVAETPAAPEPDAAPLALPAVSPSAAPLREADPTFDEREFLQGARGAYEMIVEAFAAGDLKSIRRYLSSSVYEAFRGAVAAREAAGQTVDLKFVGIDSAAIVGSSAAEGELLAEVSFSSNQVRVVRDATGAIVEGDPTRIDLVRDLWTFSRPVRASDPNWTLVATGGAVAATPGEAA